MTATATPARISSKCRPIGGQILVRREETPGTTPGGIVLPDRAKEKATRGEIVAMGSGRLLDDGGRADFEVQEGDTILFGAYAGTEVEIEGETLVVLQETDILLLLL